MAVHKIAVLAGDGIGQEVTPEAQKVLDLVGKATGAAFEFEPALVGGGGSDAAGETLSESTLRLRAESDLILFGADGGARAVNTMAYTSREIERVARAAFDVAMKRRKRLTSVDKANVLVVSQLWREVVIRVSKDYPAVTLEHVLVDNCAMALVQHP